jgi:hypothetical protein
MIFLHLTLKSDGRRVLWNTSLPYSSIWTHGIGPLSFGANFSIASWISTQSFTKLPWQHLKFSSKTDNSSIGYLQSCFLFLCPAQFRTSSSWCDRIRTARLICSVLEVTRQTPQYGTFKKQNFHDKWNPLNSKKKKERKRGLLYDSDSFFMHTECYIIDIDTIIHSM